MHVLFVLSLSKRLWNENRHCECYCFVLHKTTCCTLINRAYSAFYIVYVCPCICWNISLFEPLRHVYVYIFRSNAKRMLMEAVLQNFVFGNKHAYGKYKNEKKTSLREMLLWWWENATCNIINKIFARKKMFKLNWTSWWFFLSFCH